MIKSVYDVETGRLTQIGSIPLGGQLAGYVDALDRLVFVADFQTILVDPRTGEMTQTTAGEIPFAGWGWYDFFDADRTVFISANGDGEGCGFNPETLAWDLCYQGLAPGIDLFSSRVEDPINARVVLIHHNQVLDEVIDDVWALDLVTGEMSELLAPSE
jgi:hypothetical protein